MDLIITMIRFPLGIVATIIVLGFWLILFPFELIIAMVVLPFGAIFLSRRELKKSWIGGFPNTLRQIRGNVSNIWKWVRDD
jgi:hypothetical protein